MNLTEHFSLEEFTHSETGVGRGLNNDPEPETVETLKCTAAGMEEVRSLLGVPIIVLSGYRSPKVNSAVGGNPMSQHLKGQACDFIAPTFGTPQEVCRAILDSTIAFDQLIAEGTWVHISFADEPRRSVLTAHFANGKTTYTQGVA